MDYSLVSSLELILVRYKYLHTIFTFQYPENMFGNHIREIKSILLFVVVFGNSLLFPGVGEFR